MEITLSNYLKAVQKEYTAFVIEFKNYLDSGEWKPVVGGTIADILFFLYRYVFCPLLAAVFYLSVVGFKFVAQEVENYSEKHNLHWFPVAEDTAPMVIELDLQDGNEVVSTTQVEVIEDRSEPPTQAHCAIPVVEVVEEVGAEEDPFDHADSSPAPQFQVGATQTTAATVTPATQREGITPAVAIMDPPKTAIPEVTGASLPYTESEAAQHRTILEGMKNYVHVPPADSTMVSWPCKVPYQVLTDYLVPFRYNLPENPILDYKDFFPGFVEFASELGYDLITPFTLSDVDKMYKKALLSGDAHPDHGAEVSKVPAIKLYAQLIKARFTCADAGRDLPPNEIKRPDGLPSPYSYENAVEARLDLAPIQGEVRKWYTEFKVKGLEHTYQTLVLPFYSKRRLAVVIDSQYRNSVGIWTKRENIPANAVWTVSQDLIYI